MVLLHFACLWVSLQLSPSKISAVVRVGLYYWTTELNYVYVHAWWVCVLSQMCVYVIHSLSCTAVMHFINISVWDSRPSLFIPILTASLLSCYLSFHVFSFSHSSPPLFLLTWPLPVYFLSILSPISNPSSHLLFILCLLCSPLLLLHLFLSLCHPPVVQPLTLLSTSPSFFPLIFLSLLWLSSPSLINLHPPSCLSYSIPFILQSLITLLFPHSSITPLYTPLILFPSPLNSDSFNFSLHFSSAPSPSYWVASLFPFLPLCSPSLPPLLSPSVLLLSC